MTLYISRSSKQLSITFSFGIFNVTEHVKHTHRTAINFINDIKDLLLAISLPLVLIYVTGGKKREGKVENGQRYNHLRGAETSRQ